MPEDEKRRPVGCQGRRQREEGEERERWQEDPAAAIDLTQRPKEEPAENVSANVESYWEDKLDFAGDLEMLGERLQASAWERRVEDRVENGDEAHGDDRVFLASRPIRRIWGGRHIFVTPLIS